MLIGLRGQWRFTIESQFPMCTTDGGGSLYRGPRIKLCQLGAAEAVGSSYGN